MLPPGPLDVTVNELESEMTKIYDMNLLPVSHNEFQIPIGEVIERVRYLNGQELPKFLRTFTILRDKINSGQSEFILVLFLLNYTLWLPIDKFDPPFRAVSYIARKPHINLIRNIYQQMLRDLETQSGLINFRAPLFDAARNEAGA